LKKPQRGKRNREKVLGNSPPQRAIEFQPIRRVSSILLRINAKILTHIPGFSTYGISPNIRRILEIIEGEFVGWVEERNPTQLGVVKTSCFRLIPILY